MVEETQLDVDGLNLFVQRAELRVDLALDSCAQGVDLELQFGSEFMSFEPSVSGDVSFGTEVGVSGSDRGRN